MIARNNKKLIRLLLFAIIFFSFQFSKVQSQAVRLAWSLPRNTNLSSTWLYRKSHQERKYTILAKIYYPDSTFLDKSIKFDKRYYYYATAVDKYENESDKSNMVDTLIISVVQPHLWVYPNPFNEMTSINFTLQQPTDFELIIYNMLGQRVRTLSKAFNTAGIYEMQWNGMDDNNLPLATGIYLCQLQLANLIFTKKIILLR